MRLDALRFICAALLVGLLVSGAAGAAGSLLFLQAKTPATAMMNKEPRMIRFTGCLRSRMVRILPSPPREPYPNRRGHRKRVSDR